MKRISFLILSLAIFLACSSPTPKADQDHQVARRDKQRFSNEELKWSIAIPIGYQSVSSNNIKDKEQKVKQKIGLANKKTAQRDSLIHLINFQRNQFNQLNATMQRYNSKRDGPYEKTTKLLRKLIFDAYTNQGIKVDTISQKEIINGIPFSAYQIKIFGPSGDVIMNQIVYNTLRKGYDFSVSINYNNEGDRKTLIDAFKKSSF